MEPRINIITLGVADIPRALRFYKDGLGWPISAASSEHIAFLKLGGVVLALFSREALAKDATVSPEGMGFRGMTLAYNVADKNDVSTVLDKAKRAGARIVKPAQDVFWGGHSGYFSDPDGFLWEVAWNPHFSLTKEGSLRLP